jgi:glycosyltransferase involved in cell wall biosynthesis
VVTTAARAAVFAVPGDLATPTGGYVYDRRVVAELAALGWRTDVVDLGDGFPRPTAEARAAACARLAALAGEAPVVVDGLALGVLPEAAQLLGASRPLVALVHHPLALEAGLNADESARLRASERAALAGAHHVIVTSAPTARLVVADYDVPAERVSVVEPGTDRGAPVARADGSAVALLAVGAVVPRKGYDVLIAALVQLAALDWRLIIAGDCTRSPETHRELADVVARHGLGDRIVFRGAVATDALRALYATSDLFVLPSRFEGYGMAYAEAIAHGLPIIGTTAGAIPATVPAEAGVLVAPDDVAALAATLRRLIEHPHERERLAAGARATRFPSWSEQGARFASVLERLKERAP